MHKKHFNIRALILSPITIIYGAVVVLRNALFDWGVLPSQEFRVPVISVGNITVGGTGKTPHVEYLVELLKDDYTIACLSRGYGRRTRDFLIADLQSNSETIGDEPRQLKQKYPDITVAVDRRRVNGIQQLLKLANAIELVILDDAFQHRYVQPGKQILLINYRRLVQYDYLLPSGYLREPISGMKRADIILITKAPEDLKPIEMRNLVKQIPPAPHQNLFFTSIAYENPKGVFSPGNSLSKESMEKDGKEILLVSGIADPDDLRDYARSISASFQDLKYPDHHPYSEKDLRVITQKARSMDLKKLIILTTEKDAMRLQSLPFDNDIKEVFYYVPIHVKILNDDQEEFNQLIRNYVRSNKRDNILHREKDNIEA